MTTKTETKTPAERAKWPNDYIGKLQYKSLNDRISKIEYRRYRDSDDDAKPTHVKRAQAVINRHNALARRVERVRVKGLESTCEAARSAVLFSATPADALRAVEALEATARKRKWIAP